MAKKIDPDDLVGPDEAAPIIGVGSGRAVSVYAGRYPDFPQPIVKRGRCTLWLRQDIEKWAKGRTRG